MTPALPGGMVASTAGGIGVSAGLALVGAMEAGVPIPIPSDLLVLVLGERAAAGIIPLWLAVVGLEVAAIAGTAALFLFFRGPGHALVARLGPRVGLTGDRVNRAATMLERRRGVGIAVGRATPGLRTLTVLGAGATGLSAVRAIPALVAGSTVFLQGHLVLGYAAGKPAENLLRNATGPAVIVLVALAAVGILVWLARRGKRAGAQSWAEASCPACLAVAALVPAGADRVEMADGREER